MNLYHISQTENNNYDTFDAAIVAAESEDKARLIRPGYYLGEEWGARYSSWCSSPDLVTVRLIGTAEPGTPAGVILASFNAG